MAWRRDDTTAPRGQLRIYLGAAAGVGKTFAMLSEGHRRGERGADVVVGFAETHGRPQTAALIDGLEVVPRKRLEYRGAFFEEMDVDAVLARKPQIALVDELAHTNVPGSRNVKRWQDVTELLDAGIDVISAVNVQHLESVTDVVEQITGVVQRETVPDAVVRAADQVELVDMTAEALRRRMAHGNIYPPEKIDAAHTNYFRAGNLTALRELALLWLADKVDEGLEKSRAEQDITSTGEARERVVVALTGGSEGDTLIRRAARIAARASGGDLLAGHVTKSDRLTGANPANLARQRQLVESLGGSYHQVVGDNISEALLTFAKAENATQLVLGASRRSWLLALLTGPGIGAKTIRGSGAIDVHIVTHSQVGSRWRLLPRYRGGITARRQIAGYILAVALAPLGTLVLASDRTRINLTSDTLAFLVAVIVGALTGGFLPAGIAAIIASLLLNYYFPPPIHSWTISQANNALALGVFIAVGLVTSWVVDTTARKSNQAARANAESELLRTTAGSILQGQGTLDALLERTREAFGMRSASLLERLDPTSGAGRGPAGEWAVVACSGDAPVTRPDDADVDVPVTDTLSLALAGRPLPADDRRGPGAVAPHPAPARAGRRPAPARRPAGAGGVRLLRRRRARAAAAHGRGGGGQADRRGRPDADRAAGRRQPRPALPDRVGQGRDHVAALGGHRLGRLRHGRAARHRRRVARPAHPPGRQPARHVQAAGGRAAAVPQAVRPRRDRRPVARRPRPGRPRDHGGHTRHAARRPGRPGHPRAHRGEPDRERAPLLAGRQAAAAGRLRARRPGGAAGGGPRSRHPRGRP